MYSPSSGLAWVVPSAGLMSLGYMIAKNCCLGILGYKAIRQAKLRVATTFEQVEHGRWYLRLDLRVVLVLRNDEPCHFNAQLVIGRRSPVGESCSYQMLCGIVHHVVHILGAPFGLVRWLRRGRNVRRKLLGVVSTVVLDVKDVTLVAKPASSLLQLLMSFMAILPERFRHRLVNQLLE